MEESNVEAWMTTMQQEFTQIRAEWQDVQQAPIINGRLLRALRDTQVEQGKDIAVLKTDVAVLKTDVAVLKTGQHTIISMLDHLIAREPRLGKGATSQARSRMQPACRRT